MTVTQLVCRAQETGELFIISNQLTDHVVWFYKLFIAITQALMPGDIANGM
jgi:hypothetical protein